MPIQKLGTDIMNSLSLMETDFGLGTLYLSGQKKLDLTLQGLRECGQTISEFESVGRLCLAKRIRIILQPRIVREIKITTNFAVLVTK